MLGVGIILIVMGLLLAVTGRQRIITAAASAFLLIAIGFTPMQKVLAGPCMRETNYFCIRIIDRTLDDQTTVRILALDRLVHGYSSLDNPLKLVYPYEKIVSEVTEYIASTDGDLTTNTPGVSENTKSVQSALNTLSIGGGAYTFPRYLEAAYPQSTIDVVEIDPGVTKIAYDFLGLKPDTRIAIANEDARTFVGQLPASKQYNLILGDAFSDFSVPYHLTTREFNEQLRRHMTDDGIYILNVVDGKPFNFITTFMHTLKLTFNHVYLIPSKPDYDVLVHSPFIVLASLQPIDITRLRNMTGDDSVHDIDKSLLSSERVTEMLKNGPQFTFADDYVPVDNLLAPIFEANEASQ